MIQHRQSVRKHYLDFLIAVITIEGRMRRNQRQLTATHRLEQHALSHCAMMSMCRSRSMRSSFAGGCGLCRAAITRSRFFSSSRRSSLGNAWRSAVGSSSQRISKCSANVFRRQRPAYQRWLRSLVTIPVRSSLVSTS